MSILFKKLRGLKTDALGSNGNRTISSDRPGNVYTFKKLMFSPRGAMVIFLLLAGTGLISYMVLSWIGSYLDDRMNMAIVVHHEPAENLPPSPLQEPVGQQTISTRTDMFSGNETSAIQDAPKTNAVPDLEIPEFFVHADKTSAMTTSGTLLPSSGAPIKKASDNRTLIKSKQSNPLPSIYSADARTPISRSKDSFAHLHPTGHMDIDPSKQLETNATYTFTPAKVEPESSPQGSTSERQPVPPKIKKRPDPTHIEKAKEAARRSEIRAAQKKRVVTTASVSKLGKDFKRAMEQGNHQKVEQVLAQIRRYKGKDNSYYLKLAAFKHIHDAQYQSARQMLEQVLYNHPLDLDAGLNMAVVEIRMGKTDLARNRLEKLKLLYPTDHRAKALLSML